MRALFLIVFLCTGVFGGPGKPTIQAEDLRAVEVIKEGGIIRSQPSNMGKQIFTGIPFETKLQLLGEYDVGGWYLVAYKDSRGWIHDNFIRFVGGFEGTPYNFSMLAENEDGSMTSVLSKQIAFRIPLERAGRKPTQTKNRRVLPVIKYIKKTFHNPYSVRYVKWSKLYKRRIKHSLFWVVTVTLRAKNQFNAYILRTMHFYIRNGKVVSVFRKHIGFPVYIDFHVSKGSPYLYEYKLIQPYITFAEISAVTGVNLRELIEINKFVELPDQISSEKGL